MSSGARTRPSPPQAPRLPERYRLRRHVATGGMASVWCAEDRILDRTVAIKILAERFADDQLAVRRFKREARAAARVCGHAHVVTVFDVGDTLPDEDRPAGEGRAFIVMEYLSGGTVADAIRVGAVGRQEALRWLGEAAAALDHAHESGIVHRDIKPANFLLDSQRVLHVADFGIARLVSEETITSSEQLFGTAAYLSPEQALGRPATSASDGYALAVAAFELLVGERPFAATHFTAQARQHVEDEPPAASERNRTLPAAVDEVLRRGMAKDPEERYPTAGEFVDDLRRAVSGLPTSAPRAAAPAGLRRRPGRIAALSALGAAVAGIAAAAVVMSGGSSPRPAPAATHGRPKVATRAARHHHAAPKRTSSATTTAAAAAPGTTTTTAPVRVSASQLQATGHQQMLNGDYHSAIGTLRRAVSSSAPGSLTYAYALYDLGRSLVLVGDPGSAVPVLRTRLKIPNQTAVVQQLLDRALHDSGQAPEPVAPPSTTTAPAPVTPPPATHKHAPASTDNHGQPTGGAGLAAPAPAPSPDKHSAREGDRSHGNGRVSDQASTAIVD